MSAFMGFAIGMLIGAFLGAMGMFLLIKETALDAEIEREIQNEYNSSFWQYGNDIEASDGVRSPELEIDDELEMPKRR